MRNVTCNVQNTVNTSSQNGSKIDTNQLINASFHAVHGDTSVVGTFKLQASNDICAPGVDATNFVPTNWVDIPGATVSVTAGGQQILSLSNMAYRWVRTAFVYTSGTGSTVKVNMNAVGA